MWSREGRSRGYRWAHHYHEWDATRATSKPPAGSEYPEAIRESDARYQALVDAVVQAEREGAQGATTR